MTWDVSVVLGYLKTLSPKNSLSLKQSTLKLAMLMALISFNRCDSLHKLDLRFHYFKRDGVNFIIPAHTKLPVHQNLRKYFFLPFLKIADSASLIICNIIRNTLPSIGPSRVRLLQTHCFYQLCHLTSLSHLTHSRKTVLKDSGIDTSTFGSHSTHSASTSAAQKLGVSVSDILKVADWSRAATFIKFYHKPIAPAHPGIQVLSSCWILHMSHWRKWKLGNYRLC